MSLPVHPDIFSKQQWSEVVQLLKQLDEKQALWLSGYLAGSNQAQIAQPEPAQAKFLIAFGTETNNCRQLANKLHQQCIETGIPAEVADLAQIRTRKLTKLNYLAVITATHGDGEPPEPAIPFFEDLMSDHAARLEQLKFAVLALGDSSYEQFCVTGAAIDQRLEALGGERLLPRQDCDVDFAKPAASWMATLLAKLPKGSLADGHNGHAAPAVAAPSGLCDKNHPLTVEVLTNQNLSHPQRHHPIHHLELALEIENFPIAPGDAVGILAENPPALVALVLDASGLSGEQPVTLAGQAMPLVEALRLHRDLTIPSKGFLEFWAQLSADQQLRALLNADLKTQREFLRNNQIRDLLQRAPAHPEAQALVDALRPLQPRLYDVANSLEVIPDELHLTVKAYDYPFAGRTEQGIASYYLLDNQPGDQLLLYPHRNQRFHLPEARDAPLILIGEGTGIAPYRAFLQALGTSAAPPDCWLVFAEQQFEEDFLYQIDFQEAAAKGVLNHVDTVFYRDQPQLTLANPLLTNSERLIDWLNRDAHIYLCGDKATLDGCEANLKAYIDGRFGSGHWQRLADDKRIHRNLY